MGVFFHDATKISQRLDDVKRIHPFKIPPDLRALLEVCGLTYVDLYYIFAFLFRVGGWEKDLEGNLRCPKGGNKHLNYQLQSQAREGDSNSGPLLPIIRWVLGVFRP